MQDENLTMSQHINKVVSGSFYELRQFGTVSTEAVEMLVHSLINTRLDYCNSLLDLLPETQR